ncbi:MAG: Grx4 family monothiol glutaredoxin [Pseudomonadota bacterium]
MEQIQKLINNHKIILFTKGNKVMPACQFSAIAINILQTLDVEFQICNVFENDNIYKNIKEYSNWPTIPQLYINQKFIGGSDIMQELYNSGKLIKIITEK